MISGIQASSVSQMGEVMRLRSLLCGVVLIGLAGEACAADLFDSSLRGSQTVINTGSPRWDGFYVGGQVGAAWSGTDFSGATQPLAASLVANTTIETENNVSSWAPLGQADTNGISYGGFIGWQKQFDEAVVGFEANYNRTNMTSGSSNSMTRNFNTTDNYNNTVTVISSSQLHITDYGTLRVKGGYAIDCFLPYGFVGVAIGRADVTNSAQVIASGFDTTGVNPPYSFNQTNTDAKTGAFAYGYTIGFGVDYAVFQSLFLRAEYEYIGFGEFNSLNTHLQTARIGAGYKF